MPKARVPQRAPAKPKKKPARNRVSVQKSKRWQPRYSITAYGRRARKILAPLRKQMRIIIAKGYGTDDSYMAKSCVIDNFWAATNFAQSFADFEKVLQQQKRETDRAKVALAKATQRTYKNPKARTMNIEAHRRGTMLSMMASIYARDLLVTLKNALEGEDSKPDEIDAEPSFPATSYSKTGHVPAKTYP